MFLIFNTKKNKLILKRNKERLFQRKEFVNLPLEITR